MVRLCRRLIYKLGFRPRAGSIWNSPSLDWQYIVAPSIKLGLERGITTLEPLTPERIQALEDALFRDPWVPYLYTIGEEDEDE